MSWHNNPAYVNSLRAEYQYRSYYPLDRQSIRVGMVSSLGSFNSSLIDLALEHLHYVVTLVHNLKPFMLWDMKAFV